MTSDTKAVERVLQQRQQIELYSEELVRLAEVTLSNSRMQEMRRNMKTAQLNNLLGVALESQSVAPVRNWVLYQTGRRETSRAWQQSGFGDAVLRDIDQIRDYAQEIVTQLGSDEEAKRQFQAIYIQLVRLYAGYLRRWFVARGGQS